MPAVQPLVLIAEDEEAIIKVIKYNLEHEGYKTVAVKDGAEVLDAVAHYKPDILILDWMLPSISGVELCNQIRRNPDTRPIPIIMVTARGEESDRIQGLDSGADDYLVKPFSPSELSARIKAVLRRTRPVLSEKRLEFAGLVIDLVAYKVTFEGKVIQLGPTEFRLLCHFMEKPRQVFSREQLLDAIWGRDNLHVEIRTVDVHIRRLRKALAEGDSRIANYIKTIRSAGYILEEE